MSPERSRSSSGIGPTESDSGAPRRTGARGVAAVQRAAVDRALVDPGAATDALRLAGVLEAAADRAGTGHSAEDSTLAGDGPTPDPRPEAGPPDSPLTAPLASLAALTGMRWLEDRPTRPVDPTLDEGDIRHPFLARGAAVAVVRFGVDAEEAASMAALPTGRVAEAVADLRRR